MANLILTQYLGEWQLINKTSGRLLTSSTKETQTLLKQMMFVDKNKFTLQLN